MQCHRKLEKLPKKFFSLISRKHGKHFPTHTKSTRKKRKTKNSGRNLFDGEIFLFFCAHTLYHLLSSGDFLTPLFYNVLCCARVNILFQEIRWGVGGVERNKKCLQKQYKKSLILWIFLSVISHFVYVLLWFPQKTLLNVAILMSSCESELTDENVWYQISSGISLPPRRQQTETVKRKLWHKVEKNENWIYVKNRAKFQLCVKKKLLKSSSRFNSQREFHAREKINEKKSMIDYFRKIISSFFPKSIKFDVNLPLKVNIKNPKKISTLIWLNFHGYEEENSYFFFTQFEGRYAWRRPTRE